VSQRARLPLCPACGRDMALSRVVDREYGAFKLNSFECQPCGVSFTHAAYDGEQVGLDGGSKP
jgi:ribosomal protein L37AE/L43A